MALSFARSGVKWARGRDRRARNVLAQPLEPRTLLSAAPVIDLMVDYTPAALAQAGSFSALDGRIHRAVADTNLALANSRVNASVRLVHEAEVNYRESGVLNTDLNNLQTGSGALSGVAAMRNQYGADLVSLWTGSGTGDEAGRAFQPGSTTASWPSYGYSVVEEQYAADNYVLAHEIGHNLGAGHDISDPTPRQISYAYGKTFTLGNYSVGDIMSDVERIPYYSNPNVSFRGVATGNPDASTHPADNARVMSQVAALVANYEPTKVADKMFPVAALDEVTVNPATQTLTAKVELSDDTGVSIASLKTGDLVVTGPNGFRGTATYTGVDFGTDGPQRVATFTTGIKGFSSDPNSYKFVLQPGVWKDVLGNTNPGGTLGAPGDLWPNRAGPRLGTAYEVGTLDGTVGWFNNWIGSDDPTAFYRFTVSKTTQFTSNLTGVSGNIDELLVQDRDGNGQISGDEILSYPRRAGTSPETISLTLAPGTYDLWVAPPSLGIGSSYTLTMSTVLPQSVAAAGSISGTIYRDSNGNGVRDSGETGVSGWEVYADLNNNNVIDSGEPTAWTDGSGKYTISGLASGNYIVRAVPRAGWRQVTPINNWGQHVTLAAGQVATGKDIGQIQGTLSGSVFNDSNGSGSRQSTESGLSNWRVFLDSNGDGTWESNEPSVLTNASGNWTFQNLAPGPYTVRLVSQTNWKTTTPSAASFGVKLASGGVVNGLQFGEQWV